MGEMTLDLSQYGEFERLPAGHYHVAITKLHEGETSENSKHPGERKVGVEMTVQSGTYENKKEFTTLLFPPYDPIELGRLIKVCPDFMGTDFKKVKLSDELEELIGQEFIIRVGPQTKGNPEYNEVKRYYPLEENEHLLHDEDEDGDLSP